MVDSINKPSDFILDQDIEIVMFNILNRIKRNEKIQTQLLDTQLKNQEAQLKNQLKNQEVQLKNQEILNSILKLQDIQSKIQQSKSLEGILEQILEQQKLTTKELQDDADKGRRIVKSGIVTTTEFTIINTIDDPGHPIKAYRIKNDGPNPIFVGYNNALSRIGPEIDNVVTDPDIAGFDKILKNESANESFNRNEIRNIYILAQNGNSNYRAKLTW